MSMESRSTKSRRRKPPDVFPHLLTRAPAADIGDPQSLKLKLRVHGTTHQDANTADMIFSVAEIIEFICSFVTLEPGDLISTGTPSGIGSPKGVYLHPGDVMEAEIERIGVLKTHMVSEETK